MGGASIKTADTLLTRALDIHNLARAWQAVEENGGISGTDHVSIQVWRRNWEERLINLSRAVHGHTYKPQKLRERRIPKSSPGEFWVLKIPTVTDRVLQRAAAQILIPLFETMFLDCSYGYRPQRGLQQALQAILVHRVNNRRWVLDADIDACFDSIDHELLLRFLESDLPDDSLIPLIQSWLGVCGTSTSRGIPQGSPISPLLSNVYLHRLDLALTQSGWKLVRYADDFIILDEDQQQIQRACDQARTALNEISLRLDPVKTSIISFEQGFTFLGIHFYQDSYEYVWEKKTIHVEGDEVDWLFSHYGPEGYSS